MAGTGPAPKPGARRRNAAGSAMRLPAAGREGAPPAWPLPADIQIVVRRDTAQRSVDDIELELLEPTLISRKRGALKKKLDAASKELHLAQAQLDGQERLEGELWAELWATPQAVAWERLRWTREVAQYVRWKVAAELGSLDASKEARQLADRLGLTPLALLRLRWEIADEEEGRPRRRPTPPRGGPGGDDPRSLLHVV
ncbi:hypothetical protein [Streptomyces sp. 8L]|uniref:hypothetical protein n=1 Tax=Streptomyces sp. 8L TaxID=2877242 RepID=UPI001CD28786|nr:hypothetical protein [Streptomyces sp. 8L]MCA1218689.1 hypothetical protein [Streptomyces sp. 8L]